MQILCQIPVISCQISCTAAAAATHKPSSTLLNLAQADKLKLHVLLDRCNEYRFGVPAVHQIQDTNYSSIRVQVRRACCAPGTESTAHLL